MLTQSEIDAIKQKADEKIKLPTTSDLFKKHFNDVGGIGLFHPNIEAFFNDLNDVCKLEDSLRVIAEQKAKTSYD